MPQFDVIELSSDSDSDPPPRTNQRPASIKRESPAVPTLSSLLTPAQRARLAKVDAELEQLKRRLDEAQRRRTAILEDALRQKSSGVEKVKQEDTEEVKQEDDEEEERGKKLRGLGAGFRAAQNRREGVSESSAAVKAPETSRTQKAIQKKSGRQAPTDTPVFPGDVDDDDDFGGDPFFSFDGLQENSPPSSTPAPGRRGSVHHLRPRRKVVLAADDEDDWFEPSEGDNAGRGVSSSRQENSSPAIRRRNGTGSVIPAPAAAAANPRRRSRRVITGSDSEDFQPSGGKYNTRTGDVQSDSDVPLTTRGFKRRRMKSKTPRTAKKAKITMEDLESDEETLHAYVPEPTAAPAVVPEPHKPRPSIKHESFSDDDDLYSQPSAPPRARTSRSPSVRVIAPTTPWQAPTDWNEAIATSSDPNRKPYAHEFIQTYPPYSFPGHLPPVLPLRFTRKFLSKWLGGSAHSVLVTPAIERMRENNHRISIYYCIQPTWDPYLPQKPGDHGVRYIMVPVHDDGNCEPRGGQEKVYPTFCKRAPKQWEYVGEYQLTRRRFLPGELEAIPLIMKETWAKGIAGRNLGTKWGPEILEERGLVSIRKGETATEEQVMKWITEDRKIEFEALIYECKGYDWKLHNWLKERWECDMKEEGAGVKEEVDEE